MASGGYVKKYLELKVLVLCLLISLFLLGCSNSKEEVSDTNGANSEDETQLNGTGVEDRGEKSDIQYINFSSSLSNNILVSSSDYIFYKNLENQTKIYACNIVGCTHEDRKECIAYSPDEMFYQYPFVYTDYLYYFEINNYKSVSNLVRSNLDGSDKKTLITLKAVDMGGLIVRVDQKLYFMAMIMNEELTEDGFVDLLSVKSKLYEVDLNSGELKTISELGEYYSMGLAGLIYQNGYLYCQFNKQEGSWLDTEYKDPASRYDAMINLDYDTYMELLDVNYELYIVDLSSYEEISHEMEYGSIVGADENGFFVQQSGKLYSYDRNYRNEELLYQLDSIYEEASIEVIMIGDRMIMRRWENSETPSEYYVWDKADKTMKLLDFQLEDFSLTIQYYDNNNMLIGLTPLKYITYSYEWKYILTGTEDFLNGKINYNYVDESFINENE